MNETLRDWKTGLRWNCVLPESGIGAGVTVVSGTVVVVGAVVDVGGVLLLAGLPVCSDVV